jgi:hypothetical protein
MIILLVCLFLVVLCWVYLCFELRQSEPYPHSNRVLTQLHHHPRREWVRMRDVANDGEDYAALFDISASAYLDTLRKDPDCYERLRQG